jgi:hypothetical protein
VVTASFRIRWATLALIAFSVCLLGARRKPRTGTLQIRSLTIDADVLVDGKSIGQLPFKAPIAMRVGRHTLKVIKPGHADYIDTFQIKRRKTTTLEIDLLPISGVLRLDTDPPGAMVIIDGRQRGETPYDGELKPGERALELRLPGYSTYKQRLSVAAGAVYPILVPLLDAPIIAPVEATPWYGHWWVWAGAAVVVGGVTLAVLNQDADAPPDPPYIVGIPTVR